MFPVDAETATEAAEEVDARETVPFATAEVALVMERLGVALETVLPEAAVAIFTLVAFVLERTMFCALYEPLTVALAARRTRKVPLAEPLDCVKVAVLA